MTDTQLELCRELAGLCWYEPPDDSHGEYYVIHQDKVFPRAAGEDKPYYAKDNFFWLPRIEDLLEILRGKNWDIRHCSNWPGVPGVSEGSFAIEVVKKTKFGETRRRGIGNTLLEALLRATIAVLEEERDESCSENN